MYRIGLCEDCREDRQRVRLYLETLFQEIHKPYTYTEYTSYRNFLDEAKPFMFDILLFDVDLGGKSGIEAAVRLRKADKRVIIIFTTNYPGNVFDSFAAEPLQYLLKPLSRELFMEVMKNALSKIEDSRQKVITFSFDKVIYNIPVDSIIYFENEKRLIYIVTEQTTYKFYGKISLLEQHPLLNGFIHCHRSYLVNPAFIQRIEHDTIILTAGEKIPISRSSSKKVREQYINYISKLL